MSKQAHTWVIFAALAFCRAPAAFAQATEGMPLSLGKGPTLPLAPAARTVVASDAPGGDAPTTPADQNGEAGKPRGRRASSASEERWIASHVNLDLLPSAYAVLHHRFSLGNKINMPPIGFPASSYSLYPDLEFGLAPQTMLAVGVAGANRLGPAGTAIFYSLGLQHQLLGGTRRTPAVAIGGYGLLGPHDRHGGAMYLVASQQLTPHAYPRGAFLHAGLLAQSFSDDDSGTAARPFVGANYVWNRRLRFSGEYRPRMGWEEADPYTLSAVFMVTRRFGVSGGYRHNGYRAHPFIGVEID